MHLRFNETGIEQVKLMPLNTVGWSNHLSPSSDSQFFIELMSFNRHSNHLSIFKHDFKFTTKFIPCFNPLEMNPLSHHFKFPLIIPEPVKQSPPKKQKLKHKPDSIFITLNSIAKQRSAHLHYNYRFDNSKHSVQIILNSSVFKSGSFYTLDECFEDVCTRVLTFLNQKDVPIVYQNSIESDFVSPNATLNDVKTVEMNTAIIKGTVDDIKSDVSVDSVKTVEESIVSKRTLEDKPIERVTLEEDSDEDESFKTLAIKLLAKKDITISEQIVKLERMYFCKLTIQDQIFVNVKGFKSKEKAIEDVYGDVFKRF